MSSVVRVILFNADEGYNAALRSQLLQNEGVRIIAELDEPALMAHSVEQYSADALVVHLDPHPEVTLAMAAEVCASHPQLAVFAISESADSNLILTAMRGGVREFLTKPIDPKVLAEAFAKTAERAADTAPQGTLITTIGCGGGVGATTLATNLAVELGELATGGVTLVDLDLRFGHVASFLDLDPSYTISDLCASTEQLDSQIVERALIEHKSGIRILARPNQFADADGITAAHTVGVLSALLEMNEYVVIDGPNRFDPGAKAVVDLADVNLLVMQLLVPLVRNTSRMIEGMRQAGYNINRMKLVCNRVSRERGTLTMEDVSDTLNIPEFARIPDDWPTVSAAINLGEPLATHGPKTRVRCAIRDLAARLHGQGGEADEKSGSKQAGGLLSKIFAD